LKLSRERFVTGVFLFFVCLQLAQAIHGARFSYEARMVQCPPSAEEAYARSLDLQPWLYAPEAYRLAVPALERFLASAFHVHDPAFVAAAVDLVAAFFTLFLLYRLSVDLPSERLATPNERLLTIALFLAVIQFPIAWVIPWQHLETLPTALYLAISLFCFASSKKNKLWCLPILAATVWQAFVRADVPFIFGVAMVLTGLWESRKKGFANQRFEVALGALVVFLAGAIQSYLQFVRYPHLSYRPGTAVVQFIFNLSLHNLTSFMIAMLPFLLFSAFLIVKRPRLDSIDRLVLMSSALYLPVWLTVGIIDEVRVYVPFLFALSMVAAKVSAPFLTREYRPTQ
jgi:hypothetical protein